MTTSITYRQAQYIRQRYRDGRRLLQEAAKLSNEALAQKFDVSISTIEKLSSGITWVSGAKSHYTLTVEDVELLRSAIAERNRLRRAAANMTVTALAKRYGLTEARVCAICTGNCVPKHLRVAA